MSLERIRKLIRNWRTEVRAHEPNGSPSEVPGGVGRDLLESMLGARHLDLAAHELRGAGHGHYTICSAGHEANVVLGHLTRTDDPAMVHYRSAAFQLERARQAPEVDAIRDIARSLVASSDDPISGGRHKVFGNARLGIIPQTSTIASHLPRAVGIAFGLERRPRLGLERRGTDDSLVLVSFGDASLNHSTALGALNAAGWTVHQHIDLPLLFVCEDNALGISVRSPPGWIETRLRALPHVEYFRARGWDLSETWASASAAIDHCREKRRPAVLHLECRRLLGHAGSDVDATYRTPAELEDAEQHDPVLRAAFQLIDAGVLTVDDALALEGAVCRQVQQAAHESVDRPKLTTRGAVLRPLAAPIDEGVLEDAGSSATPGDTPLTLAQGINAALSEALQRYPEALVFGEDVAKKGGVYGITKGLLGQFGPARVFNTLLDEQTILGLALGTSTMGLLPVPEIQYLAYLHNAEDQLRGEAATLRFFSNGAFDNPLVVRIAGFAYQKGFGGHFHNDNAIAVLRDIPGIVVVVPSRADDAAELLRTAFALARRARRVVAVIEPIALYHTRDLHTEGDGRWAATPTLDAAPFGRARTYHGAARDLSIITYGNGVRMSLRAADRLRRERDIGARVVDLRFLAPLPIDDVVRHAGETGRVLVVDECRRSASVSEALAAALFERAPSTRFDRVTSSDCFVPLGDAANLVLLNEEEVFEAATQLVTA